jgi:hypothetical protein
MQLPGTEFEKGIVKALDDLLGPAAREVGTALGEWVRRQRGARLRKTLDRAAEIANNDSLNAPPAKFLLPYLENASLEEEDAMLNEMWAHLLVDAGNKYNSRHPVFVDLLKRLDHDSAALLEKLAAAAGGVMDDSELVLRIGDVVEDIEQSRDEDVETWHRLFADQGRKFGHIVWKFYEGITTEDGEFLDEGFVAEFAKYEDEAPLSALRALGLVTLRQGIFREKTRFIEVELVAITHFGTQFYVATHAGEEEPDEVLELRNFLRVLQIGARGAAAPASQSAHLKQLCVALDSGSRAPPALNDEELQC